MPRAPAEYSSPWCHFVPRIPAVSLCDTRVAHERRHTTFATHTGEDKALPGLVSVWCRANMAAIVEPKRGSTRREMCWQCGAEQFSGYISVTENDTGQYGIE